MAVAELADVQHGDMVLDLCAAPGGKSSHIACKLNGTGLLVANEIIPNRAKVLSENIERMGVRNCIVTNESPTALATKWGAIEKTIPPYRSGRIAAIHHAIYAN